MPPPSWTASTASWPASSCGPAPGGPIDGFLDPLADVAITGGLGAWSLTQDLNPSIAVGLTAAASAGSLLSMATKDRIAALKLPRAAQRPRSFLLGGCDRGPLAGS